MQLDLVRGHRIGGSGSMLDIQFYHLGLFMGNSLILACVCVETILINRIFFFFFFFILP